MGNNPSVDLNQAQIEAINKELGLKEKAINKELELKEKESKARIDAMFRTEMIGTAVVGGVGLLLVADFIAKRHIPFLKWRMKRDLRKKQLFPSRLVGLEHDASRRYAFADAMTTSLPMVIVGPTGCGKSTLLEQIRDAYPAASSVPRPVKFISIRALAKDNKKDHDHLAQSPKRNSEYVDAANQILKTLKFPTEPLLLSQVSLVFENVASKMEKREEMLTDRLLLALDLLFDNMAEIKEELHRKAPSADTTGLIIFDEVQDLLRTDRFANAGGSDVFNRLANLTTRYAVTNKNVRVIFAGSSSFLPLAFSQTVLKSGRRNDTYLEDYPPHAVVKWLVDQHHVSANDAKTFTDKVGTRLRLLEPLISKASDKPVQLIIDDIYKSKRLEIANIMGDERLKKVFDDLADGKDVSLKDLPADLQSPDKISSVFYLCVEKVLFQDKVVATIWKTARMKKEELRNLIRIQMIPVQQ